jgi:hypothetical protein
VGSAADRFRAVPQRPGEQHTAGKSTEHRILRRHGLIEPGRRRRKRRDYVRWEREAPMALWQLDIVGGLFLANGTECKVATGSMTIPGFVSSPRW